MEALFIRILNMSLSAAVVIAAVLLARLALRRTPKKWSYLLWSVVGFRLCCPVSLKAAFSLFRLKAIAPGVTPVTVQAGTVSATAEPVNAVAYVPQNIAQMAQPRLDVGTEAISEAVSSVLPAAQPFESVNPLQIWLLVGIVLWCAGMAVMLVYAAVRYIKMRRLLSDAVLLRYEVFERERLRMLEDAAQLRGRVFESDRIRSPFLLGLFRPRVYVPAGLDEGTLRCALAHEQFHLRHGDHAVKLFSWLLLAVHWFNPLCWLAFACMSRDMEMRCDERVIAASGGSRAYSRSLLAFASGLRFPSPGPLAFGETGVKRRIRNALRWKPPKRIVTLLAAVLSVAVIVACAANPTEKPGKPSEIQDYPPIEGLRVTVTDATSMGIAFTVRNDSDTEYRYTQRYTPEKRLPDGQWGPIERKEGSVEIVDSIAWTIPPRGSAELRYTWSGAYGDFSAGEYRILIPLLPESEQNVLCVPFVLPYAIGWEPGYPWELVRSDKELPEQSEVWTRAENVRQTGMRLIVHNSSDSKISMGSEYFLQLRQEGLWYDIDVPAPDWPAEIITLSHGRESAFDVDWMGLYGALPAGDYRLVKEYRPGGGAQGEPAYLFCEFELRPATAPAPLAKSRDAAQPLSTPQTLPDAAQEALAAYLQRRKDEGAAAGKLGQKYERFEPVRVLYQDASRIFILMKDESKGYKEETAKPRMLVTLEKQGGAWNVWDATDWQDTEHGWETVQNRVNGLFYSYRTAPTRAEIEQALKHLQSFGKGNKLLSTCFPSAGSRPEMWDEFFAAYPGQLEFVYDEAQSMDFILREYYRVYGVENLDFAEPVFVLSLRKLCEIDEERFPSIGHFFREDGNGDEIRIVVRVGEYGTYYMSADLWAGSRIAASQQYIIEHYDYRRLEACTNLDAPRIVETELDGGVYLITENVGSAPFYRADFDFPATSFGEATLFLNREGRIIGHYMYE